MGKKIIWINTAIAQFHEEFLELLAQTESIEITSRIFDEVFDSVSILQTHSEIYKLDEFKKNNLGNVRAFEKHTYRISYQTDKEIIYILRVRNARKEPLPY